MGALHIERFECNMFQENCYILNDETKECVIIDCGAFYEEERKAVTDYITENGLKPKHLICTHAHIDHNFGNNMIFNKFGLRPELCHKDKTLMENLPAQAQALIGLTYKENVPQPGLLFDEDYIVEFGSHKLSVIHTPGHSPGSVMFYCKEENVVFSGDTLFRMSVGRTDFQFGSFTDIVESLRRVVKLLPADTLVLPGHSEQTTIGFEAQHNPYIR